MQQEYTIVLIISLLVFRMLVIIIHEFGHAIATLLNSDGNVTVYIGSYGNPEKSFRFQFKRLECFMKYNVFKWKGGLCVPHGENISWKGSFFISLFGPVTTLFIACIAGTSLLFFEKYSAWNVIFFALAFTCMLDFIYNIIPRKTQIELHDGTFTNNDGKSLLDLLKLKPIYKTYKEAMVHFNAKEYVKSGELFEECLTKISNNQEVYRLAISSYLQVKNHKKATEIQEIYSKNYTDDFDYFDYVNLGVIQIYTDDFEKALDSFKKAQIVKADDKIILYNLGLTYGLLAQHDEAITYADKVISIDPNFQHAWGIRGVSKIKLGQLEAGYEDLQKSLELDDQDPYVHRNLGVYYFYKKDYQKALELYKKALDLDPDTFQIQKYIDEVKVELNR